MNPLQDMRDMWTVDLEVASALQNPRSSDSSQILSEERCRVIHFAMVKLDYALGVVSGGFSKVFFGTYLNQKVAVKMLFVMVSILGIIFSVKA